MVPRELVCVSATNAWICDAKQPYKYVPFLKAMLYCGIAVP